MGKTEVIYQVAKEFLNLPVISRRTSQLTEGETLGLQKPDSNLPYTEFRPMDWFWKACDQPTVLLLDELDRAIPEVRQSLMELADSRRMCGIDLHPESKVVACINGGKFGDRYSVNIFDPAELDRWHVIDCEFTFQDWLDWAQGNVHQIVREYLIVYPKHLEHTGTFSPKEIYPSRRSWARLSESIYHILNDFLEQKSIDKNLVQNLIWSEVGAIISINFLKFLNGYKFQVSLQDILDGKLGLVEGFSDNEFTSLIHRFQNSEIFKNSLNDGQCQNIADFLGMMPSEQVMVFYTFLMDEQKNCKENVFKIHELMIRPKGQEEKIAVRDYVLALIMGKEEMEKV